VIKAFQQREGVRITTVYNGCGILVAQMKAGQRPDAYFSCDVSFMDQVEDLFLDSIDVSKNDMIILVGKGNPKEIQNLKDLTKPGLKVGLAHPVQSALGALTKRMLRNAGLYEALIASKNVAVESATGDFLVNQIRVGSLDAVIVYRSNAAYVKDHLDIVDIELPDAFAIQPYAVARNTDHKRLMERFFDSIKTQQSKERFESIGFRWRLKED